jgi:hypothetical protein
MTDNLEKMSRLKKCNGMVLYGQGKVAGGKEEAKSGRLGILQTNGSTETPNVVTVKES